MAKKHKATLKHEFNADARQKIYIRDRGNCIFCEMDYKTERGTDYAKSIKSVMHYVPRSQGGLGIPENGAVGCQYHHELMDNGSSGSRAEMLEMFKQYLQAFYPGWNKEKLVYDKWSFLKED